MTEVVKTEETELLAVAQAVREACIQAALDGHEQAGLSGLCAEGRWELAIDYVRSLDLKKVLKTLP
ncbi:MAG TPA: hypothetical protein VF285_04205 [Castellaniella sp.]|uniref:hypothetical protein n=1 Tax=Castellaniella sp. TaxID=1955812 RepID=UPI002F034731